MRAILDALRALIRWISLALLVLLIVTPLAQVVMRGVFTLPFSGAEELARYFLICLSFFAASYVTREGGQIRMEEVQALLPPKPRWLVQILIEASGVVLFGFIAFAAALTITRNMDNRTATLEMPFLVFMAPLALGATLLAFETAAVLVKVVSAGHAHAKATNLT